MLEATGQAHGYFMRRAARARIWKQGFCSSAAENQAPGWPVNNDEDATIDAILKAMMDEGPGGGHHDNILAASSTRVGVGLVVDAQQAALVHQRLLRRLPLARARYSPVNFGSRFWKKAAMPSKKSFERNSCIWPRTSFSSAASRSVDCAA